jgi:hypothetical protein
VIEEEVKAYQRQLDEGLKWLLGALDANNRKRSRRFHAYVKDLVSKVKNDTKLKDLQAIRFHLQYAEELMQRYQDFTSSASSSSTSASGASSGDSVSSSSNTRSGSFTSREREVEVKTTVTPTLINLGDEDDDDYDEEGEDDLDLDDLDLEDVDFHGW